ncbi:hypothetical protein [Methylobacterium sp. A54F]
MMTRNATPSLDSFDPDVLDAARDVARRAGVPLETWLASVVPGGVSEGRKRGRPQPNSEAPRPKRTAAEAPMPRAAKPAKSAPPRSATPDEASLDALMRRLDGLDRTIASERRATDEASGRRLEEIERRMAALGEQFAASRPMGRRGRSAEAETRDAVAAIRERQRQLEVGTDPDAAEAAGAGVVATMRQDLLRRLEAQRPPLAAEATDVIAELQRETARLRDSINALATGQDVGKLEQAVISLATGVERAQQSADLVAIAGPVEQIRAQVEQLADDVAENVHARVSQDVERLAARVDGALAASGGDVTADRGALASLFGELEEIRRLIAGLAGPERIQSLVQGLQAISAQIADLRSSAGGESAGVAGLRPILEEIRSGLRSPAPADLAEQVQSLAEKLDALHQRGAGADSEAILGRIDALSDKVDRVSASPVGDLIGRLENLGETLKHPALPGGDVASIHAALRNLAEKVDRVGARPGGEGLDALEQQVVTLANRLEAPGRDPGLASLERTMTDLLQQVSALRAAAPDEAAVERAARNAVADTIGAARTAPESGELALLRASLAELQARQVATDQRMQATLEGVQQALDRVASRVAQGAGPIAPEMPAPVAPRAQSLDDRLLGSTAVEEPLGRPEPARVRAPRRPEAPRTAVPEAIRVSDELLEPGAARPVRDRRPVSEPEDSADPSSDIKTSFIAAARRAAQAAQAEVATEAALAGERREPRGARKALAGEPTEAQPRIARLRAELDRRRRPLLLGLAAIVLALGALQAIGTYPFNDAPSAPAPVAVAAPKEAPAAPVAPPQTAPEIAAAPQAPAAPADPQTTQAITPAAPVSRNTAVPQVSGMAALAGELGGVPTGLSKVRQAALDGDGAAIYELAAREADGRGMPRDLAVAAKLYERLASAGYAPAQYKLAGQYEKGSGVVRDLAQAKLWYGRAAEQGHARSMHNLAVLYAENPGASGRPDYASASAWFRRAAEFGVRDSQYNLAVLYARGLGMTQDLVQSYAWFSAAAAQGDEDAAKKRDDVATKLSPGDLANARAAAANFKPRKPEPAVNEPPAPRDGGAGAMTLLGAPTPSAGFTAASRKGV